MDDHQEILEVVDSSGRVVGTARRSELHGNPALIHRVVHLLVFSGQGNLLLQKRSMNKDIAPGRWDTSVGGHVNPGETVRAAAVREMREELGIEVQDITYLYQYVFIDDREAELVSTFSCVYDREFLINHEEIDEIRYWNMQSIRENIGKGVFSDHFEKEFSEYLRYRDTLPKI
jgi:isopentenyl-diphosphate delta-isomerase type 1